MHGTIIVYDRTWKLESSITPKGTSFLNPQYKQNFTEKIVEISTFKKYLDKVTHTDQ